MFAEATTRTNLYVGVLTFCLAAASALACCRLAWTTGGFVASEFAAGALLFVIWRRGDVSLRTILVLAVLFRLFFFWLPPALSDDAYRYVWDGLVQANGINPFALRPVDAELAFLRSEPIFERLNSATYYSVYPPLSQLLFRFGAEFYDAGWHASYYVIKAVLAFCEMGALWLLSRRIQPRSLLLYAWNPLVIFAAAGQAHTEAAAVLFLVSAWTLADRGRPVWASTALAAAGLVKLYPFVLLPLLWRRFGWRSVWPAGLTVAVLSWPYVHPDAIAHLLSSLDLYVRSFEFNAGLYYGVKKLLSVVTGEDWSKQIGPALRWLFLASMIAVYYLDRRFDWPIRRAMVVAVGLFFVCSTTVHPWYLLPLLGLLAPVTPPSWHWYWLGLASMGTYLLYVSGPYWTWVAVAWTGWLIFGTVRYARPAFDAVLTLRARKKVSLLADYLPSGATGTKILDLGAAEGYVGREIARTARAAVTLADVVCLNRTDLVHVVYDGRRLPFERDRFDVVVLVYVLHHAESAESLLAEAARVCARRIIVLESIVTSRAQRFLLALLDRLANTLRAADRKTALGAELDFRRFDDWMHTFRAAGLEIEVARDLGGYVHHRALFVLAKSNRVA